MGWCWKSVHFYLVCWHPFLSCVCYCSSAVELKRNLNSKLQTPPFIFWPLENSDTRWTQRLLVFNLWAWLCRSTWHTNTSSCHGTTLASCTLHSQVPTHSSLVPFWDSESLVDEKQGTNVQMLPACFGHDRADGMEKTNMKGSSKVLRRSSMSCHILFCMSYWKINASCTCK